MSLSFDSIRMRCTTSFDDAGWRLVYWRRRLGLSPADVWYHWQRAHGNLLELRDRWVIYGPIGRLRIDWQMPKHRFQAGLFAGGVLVVVAIVIGVNIGRADGDNTEKNAARIAAAVQRELAKAGLIGHRADQAHLSDIVNMKR